MTKYNNGKIYKIEPICEHDEGDIYIGSTTKEYLSQRMTAHKYSYNKWQKNTQHKYSCFDIFDKYGIDNVKIVLIELVNANSKDELISKESEHIRNTKCVNKVIPNRTQKEYIQNNKEKICSDAKKYWEQNKIIITEKKKIYYKKNKNKVNTDSKIYYEKNKNTINEKIICECGSECAKYKLARHKKTKKHQDYIINNLAV